MTDSVPRADDADAMTNDDLRTLVFYGLPVAAIAARFDLSEQQVRDRATSIGILPSLLSTLTGSR
ncbi:MULTISPECIES: hypothetical protein [Streptacidiphilus]|uniref:Uncharacterized protein n=1 Tax=Streptacidiphilus cavernicola TaxID=3342716 RepID=A0ABV6UNZ5_9ACTN|nr:hypothetical protein [Streptacidiphilus jeojiense]